MAINYFKLKYSMNMSVEEVDETDGTLIDVYMIALSKINEDGGGGSQKDNSEIKQMFMG